MARRRSARRSNRKIRRTRRVKEEVKEEKPVRRTGRRRGRTVRGRRRTVRGRRRTARRGRRGRTVRRGRTARRGRRGRTVRRGRRGRTVRIGVRGESSGGGDRVLLALSQAERMRRRLKDNDDLHQTWNQFEEETNKTLDWDTPRRAETGPPTPPAALPGSDFWDFVSTVREPEAEPEPEPEPAALEPEPDRRWDSEWEKWTNDDYLAPGTLVSDDGREGMYMGFKKNTFGANEHMILFNLKLRDGDGELTEQQVAKPQPDIVQLKGRAWKFEISVDDVAKYYWIRNNWQKAVVGVLRMSEEIKDPIQATKEWEKGATKTLKSKLDVPQVIDELSKEKIKGELEKIKKGLKDKVVEYFNNNEEAVKNAQQEKEKMLETKKDAEQPRQEQWFKARDPVTKKYYWWNTKSRKRYWDKDVHGEDAQRALAAGN